MNEPGDRLAVDDLMIDAATALDGTPDEAKAVAIEHSWRLVKAGTGTRKRRGHCPRACS